MMSTPNYRRGFTLLEATIVSGLLAMLAVLLSSAWVGMGRTAIDLIGRSQLVQERDFAIAALSRDLGGRLADPNARVGEKTDGKWLAWASEASASLPPNVDLLLTYNKHAVEAAGVVTWVSPNTTIRYYLADDPNTTVTTYVLMRKNQNTGEEFLVARYLSSMKVEAVSALRPNAFTITLGFQYRKLTLTCDLTTEIP